MRSMTTGLESKIEVPSDVVRDVVPGQEYALVLSWTLQPVVSGPSPSGPTPPARAPTPLPTAVDEEFMALMARPRGPVVRPGADSGGVRLADHGGSDRSTDGGADLADHDGVRPPTSGAPTTSVAEQLAQRLGIRSSSPHGLINIHNERSFLARDRARRDLVCPK
jgi:hypothetical protein